MTTTTITTERRRLTVLRAARLFDGTGSTLLADPMVVLDGTTILAVDHATTAPPPAPRSSTCPTRPCSQG